ncbi:uncharacterized protein KD926_004856 [Aspergillus affinis]|uniref:uncharacterized protein n=1 Tax=Aspergillus affinis TaxID=1070780 RepID=UPI0022FEB57B|nr:uncharacterized protein KD926_004856 [Aspergillus affinis]KAI9034975.1 hypothetical protein KD926_004856 [Aspergillus affinis]
MQLSQTVVSEDESDRTNDLSPIFSDEDDASDTSTSESEPDSSDDPSEDDPSNDNSILDDEFCRNGKYDPVERFRWLSDSKKTVLAVVVKEKKLKLSRRPKATMYIEDVAEFARVLLLMTEITFQCGWLRI